MSSDQLDPVSDVLLRPAEVAAIFRVNPKTVSRWANAGWINAVRTPGGQRRFHSADVTELLRLRNDGYGLPLEPGVEVDVEVDDSADLEVSERVADPLLTFVRWVVSLDEPGSEERRRITLNKIIENAADVLRVVQR